MVMICLGTAGWLVRNEVPVSMMIDEKDIRQKLTPAKAKKKKRISALDQAFMGKTSYTIVEF